MGGKYLKRERRKKKGTCFDSFHVCVVKWMKRLSIVFIVDDGYNY